MIVEKIHALEPGDRVRVDTWACSWPDQEVTVLKREQDSVVVVSDQEVEYYLVPSYQGQRDCWVGSGQPWMRTVDGYDSRGEIWDILHLE